MKVSEKRFPGKNREATNIEKSIRGMLQKYGYEFIYHVVNRVLTREKDRRNLEADIARKEAELEELKKKKP